MESPILGVVGGLDAPREDPVELERWLWQRVHSEIDDRDVDLTVFEQLPRWLQGAVLEDHEVLWTTDTARSGRIPRPGPVAPLVSGEASRRLAESRGQP